jgi:hypothetical protein
MSTLAHSPRLLLHLLPVFSSIRPAHLLAAPPPPPPPHPSRTLSTAVGNVLPSEEAAARWASKMWGRSMADGWHYFYSVTR